MKTVGKDMDIGLASWNDFSIHPYHSISVIKCLCCHDKCPLCECFGLSMSIFSVNGNKKQAQDRLNIAGLTYS